MKLIGAHVKTRKWSPVRVPVVVPPATGPNLYKTAPGWMAIVVDCCLMWGVL